MKKIGAFFKLVRWPNLLITALTMCLVWHCIMGLPSTLAFTLLVIAMVMIQAGGYVINDIFDMEIDAINKPGKRIVGEIFTERQTNLYYIVLTIIGLGCGLAASIMAHGKNFYTVFAALILLACFLYSYSSRYKRELVIGNLIVSLSVAFAVFLPWLFQILSMLGDEAMLLENQEWMRMTLHIVLIYTVFAFSMTLIREIVKDMEDMEGDGRFHCHTIPVVWGVKTAQIIVMVLSLLAFIMIIYAKEYLYGFGLKTTSYLLNASGVFMFMMVFGGSIFGMLDASFRTAKQFRMQSIAMKISMLIGVLSIIFIK
jgi:4-hydroxybenzoate polyprenyltransferase